MKLAGSLLAASSLAAAAAWAQDGRPDSVIGPDYAVAPEVAALPGQPVGQVETFTMESADSAAYPGIRTPVDEAAAKRDGSGAGMPLVRSPEPAPYRRRVWVYIPRQYRPGTEAPLLVVQDGGQYKAQVARALDGLIARHRVPVMIAVMPDAGGGSGPGSERGLEYDTVSGRYATFVEREVLPRVARDFGVRFTSDPDGRASMGGSSGAAAAFTMAWFHPEWYRKVLSYSGTFVDLASPVDPETPDGAWGYHARLVPGTPPKPIRVWMEVGDKDLGAREPDQGRRNWVTANRRMAAALAAKGYDHRFVFAQGAAHVDPRVVDQTLPAALEWLWRDYPR